jgi:hypothetical protein
LVCLFQVRQSLHWLFFSMVEHKNTHFDCVFGQTMPMDILSFISFMRRDEFILLCNDKTWAGRKTNCMLTRKLEKHGLKICYYGCAIATPFSTKKPQFCSNNLKKKLRQGCHLQAVAGACAPWTLQSKVYFQHNIFKLNFVPNIFKILSIHTGFLFVSR